MGNSGADWERLRSCPQYKPRYLFQNFGNETITRETHLEKLTLVRSGIGRDMISDFTTNLIKSYLLEYTQAFATTYLNPRHVRKQSVPRVAFDYAHGVWVHASSGCRRSGPNSFSLRPETC